MLVTDQAVLRDYKGEFNEKFNEMEGREDVEAFLRDYCVRHGIEESSAEYQGCLEISAKFEVLFDDLRGVERHRN